MSLPIVGIHLDLKYMMPRKAFLEEWVAALPAKGINTLLLEYEDKFPFSAHPFLRARNAFTPDELRRFLSAARSAGLRIVPLVQTLSHLEFALSHAELAHLREAPHIPTQVDTSNPEASEFVEGLIDEVLAYHEDDEFFHLGGDEAWHMGHNQRSKAQLERLGPAGLWASHMLPLARRIVARKKRPLFWGDVVAGTPSILAQVDFPRQSAFLSWHYSVLTADSASRHLAPEKAIREAGYDVIAAPCLNWGVLSPQHLHCLRNTAEMTRFAKDNGFLGVINTAWACFHVLPHAQDLYIAATAEAAQSPDTILDPAWRDAWLADYFGAPLPGLDEALEVYGRLTEFGIKGLERPLTLVVYGYMDYLLELGSQERRRAEGGYPSDISGIDQRALFQKKLERLRETPQVRDAAVAKLDAVIEQYARHAAPFDQLAAQAVRNRPQARYLSVAAGVKLAHARILRALLRGEVPAPELGEQWADLGRRLVPAIAPFIEPDDLETAKQLWWGHVSW